jgi:O-antigen/teichoic acid export membrane protein
MTTPGRRARPTAADGDPGTGGHPGNGIPAWDADYGPASDPTGPLAAVRETDYGLTPDPTRSPPRMRDADYRPAPGRTRPGPGTRDADRSPAPGRTRPGPGARRAAAQQPPNPGSTPPRHAAAAGPDERMTPADLRARIARTIEDARSTRNAGTGRPAQAAGARPGPGGDAASGPPRTAGPSRTAGARAAATPSLLRSSGAMAVGTIASRVTGFVRSAILIYSIGTHDLGNAYNVANTLPNIVYNLALGGILSSVVVPLLVNAAKRSRDHGEAYDQRIFTLGVLALGGITVIATAAAVPIASVYAGNIGNAATYHLTVIFAYFFIPQIFFYGVSSLAGAILNARGSFAAPMWTPVINNLVVIVVGLGFIATAGLNQTPASIPGAEVQLLGLGTTLGIVLQTVALIPSLRQVRFRWRPRYDFRRGEVSEIGRMSGWMFGYVITTQIAFLVTTRVANSAGARVSQQAAGAGFAAYSNAYMLFQLPYAIVGISVITAMLPRMSAHASEGKYRLVSSDFSTATRLASVIVVPAALTLAVLGGPLAEGVFG